jgi:hypothetical protein
LEKYWQTSPLRRALATTLAYLRWTVRDLQSGVTKGTPDYEIWLHVVLETSGSFLPFPRLLNPSSLGNTLFLSFNDDHLAASAIYSCFKKYFHTAAKCST